MATSSSCSPAGLVGVQLAGTVYMVVVTPVLPLWLDPLFLIAVSSLCTGVLTLPLAIKLERMKWLSELTSRLLLQFVAQPGRRWKCTHFIY